MPLMRWMRLLLLAGLCLPAGAALAADEARLLLIKPVVQIPEDYEAVLKKAGRAKASLVVLPLRNIADGHEGAFEFADFALKSGLFGKVSVGDDLGRADYAVTGVWNAWTQPHGAATPGLARWMDAYCTLKMDLLFEGKAIDKAKIVFENASAEVYLNPPFSPLQLSIAARTCLYQAYQVVLYSLAHDILKRSGQ